MANNQESTRDDARNQALAQVASICEMIAAYDVDYDRLEELRDEYENLDGEPKQWADKGKAEWNSDYTTNPGEFAYDYDLGRELAELENAAGDCESQDDAETLIEQDPLSVEYRSDWVSHDEEMTRSEFRIVLCTGGPHVEIVGEIDHTGEPCRCWINYRDWGTSGELTGADFDHGTVLRYCGFFVTGY